MRASTVVGCVVVVAVALASAASGCVSSYQNALGFRAREAARARDVDAFEALMAEASTSPPRHTYDNPKRTVLAHFLDLGGDARFMPTLERWRGLGWVDDAATCAIERARWRGVAEADPEEADRAADACISRARAAALEGSRAWEVEACLAEAPFLVVASTVAVARFAAIAADPVEPEALRAALLDGLTHVFLAEPARLRENDGALTEPEARALATTRLHAARARFLALVAEVRATTDVPLLARGTAFGALELERVSLALDEPFLARFVASGAPDDLDLAWAWVRAMKDRGHVARLDPLGLFDHRREPREDAYWYVCARRLLPPGEPAETIVVSGFDARAASPCPVRPGQSVLGPFPLEATARGAAALALEGPETKS